MYRGIIKLLTVALLFLSFQANLGLSNFVIAEEGQEGANVVTNTTEPSEQTTEPSVEPTQGANSEENLDNDETIVDDTKNEEITTTEEDLLLESNSQNNLMLETNTISPRSVGQVFAIDGINYKVLTEDASTMTGTVQVGIGSLEAGAVSCNALVNCSTRDSLIIPDTITNKGYTYTVNQIGSSAFQNAPISHLTVPSGIARVGYQAFSSSSIKELYFAEGLKEIYEKAFIGSAIEVLTIPSTVEKLHGALFSSASNIKTIYLNANPDTVTLVNITESGNIPFYGLTQEATVILPSQEMYEKWKLRADKEGSKYNTFKICLTYEMKMIFVDKNLNPINVNGEMHTLFLKSIKYLKQSNGAYYYDRNTVNIPVPSIPTNLGYEANYWGITPLGLSVIDGSGNFSAPEAYIGSNKYFEYSDIVDSPYMVAVEDKFKINITPALDRPYNGETGIGMSFNRNVGDYFKDGTRKVQVWIVDDAAPKRLSWSFKSNVLNPGIYNVADTGKYRVGILYYNTNITPLFYTWQTDLPAVNDNLGKEYNIKITPAVINVNPKTETRILWSNQQTLPEIKYSDTDLDGTISWDVGQSPLLGKHSYTYTYIPDNLDGKNVSDKTKTAKNFTTDKLEGTIEIEYYENQSTPAPDNKPEPEPTSIPTPFPVPTPTATPKPATKPTFSPSAIPTESPSVTPNSPKGGNSKTDIIVNEVEKVEVKTRSGNKIFDTTLNIYIEKSNDEAKKEIEKKIPNLLNSFDIIVEENGVKKNETVLNESIVITIDYEQYKNYTELKVLQNNGGEYKELDYEIIYDGNTPTAIQFTSESTEGIAITGIEIKKQGFNWLWLIPVIAAAGVLVLLIYVRKREKE
ncbi:leucine-rich repeat domain-containing protein [Anaerorhabdus furcosa]|uniref:Leucine rich repeat-containing protein n=1 Tax=Anaerorhabdus furcosa TaxID=118967 RepID=A0A1T4MM32_9FIRM|nr:leucine-rich repeat domain-containing protein [Anaerorhabdus furcosa]SJZ67876.1 Leucine rich repeat-containing protein [Anaerorhabdus furcosa]